MLKKTLMLVVSLLSFGVCSPGEVNSSQTCRPIVTSMLDRIIQDSPNVERKKELNALRVSLLPMMEKVCKKGHYKLGCLQQVNQLEFIQFCKKKRK
ncbi:MAG: TIGR04454 family lipoprotein [Spirochaetota bacterium]